MKRFTYVLLPMLAVSVVACEVDQAGTEAEVEGEVTEVTIPEQERQMLLVDVDESVSEFNQELTELESELATMPEEVRAEVEGEIQNAREELQDVETLRAELNQATSVEAWRETRSDLWEEIRDIDMIITEARMEAADELAEFRTVVETERDELDREIVDLEAEAETVAPEARAEWDENLTELREQREAFNEDLQELESATEDTWESVRANIVEGWRDLKSTFYSVRIPDVDLDMDVDADVDTTAME